MTLISALLVIVYFARVMTEDMCKPENIQREVQDTIERNYNRPHSYLNWIRYPNATVITLEREANCSQIQWETYFHWIFLVVGVQFFCDCFAIAFLNDNLINSFNFLDFCFGPWSFVHCHCSHGHDGNEKQSEN